METGGVSIFNVPSVPVIEPFRRTKTKDIEKLAMAFYDDPTEINFTLLYKRVYWGLKAFVYGILENSEQTDDVLSRTMETVWTKIGTFNKDRGKFSTWIYKIALNNCLLLKKRGYDKFIDGSVTACAETIYDSSISEAGEGDIYGMDIDLSENFDLLFKDGVFIDFTERKIYSNVISRIFDKITELPENFRTVLEQRYIDKKSVKDISEYIGAPVSSVKNWLYFGLKRLKELVLTDADDVIELYFEFKSKNH